jgi:hypothetical protein
MHATCFWDKHEHESESECEDEYDHENEFDYKLFEVPVLPERGSW